MGARVLLGAAALSLSIVHANAFGQRDFGDWQEVWPPEPYVSQAIAAIEAGQIHWSWQEQDFIDGFGCLRSALGCSIGSPRAHLVYISEDATRFAACVTLVHEAAHLFGWAGNHAGGHSAPRPCPLSDGARP